MRSAVSLFALSAIAIVAGRASAADAPVKGLVTGGKDNAVNLWDASDGRLIASFRGHEKTIAGVAFSNDDRFILSGSDASFVIAGARARAKALSDIPL